MKSFYIAFGKGQKRSDLFQLSWSQYIILSRIIIIEERNFYEIEAVNNNWKVKELERQIDSALYERLSMSRNKEEVKALSERGQIVEKSQDIIKDPLVLEFLGLDELPKYSENDLESAIISHIEKFIMELGKGFLFQGRQDLTVLPSKDDLKRIVDEEYGE